MITKLGEELNEAGKKFLQALEVQDMSPFSRGLIAAQAVATPTLASSLGYMAGQSIGKGSNAAGLLGASLGLGATLPKAIRLGDAAIGGKELGLREGAEDFLDPDDRYGNLQRLDIARDIDRIDPKKELPAHVRRTGRLYR